MSHSFSLPGPSRHRHSHPPSSRDSRLAAAVKLVHHRRLRAMPPSPSSPSSLVAGQVRRAADCSKSHVRTCAISRERTTCNGCVSHTMRACAVARHPGWCAVP
ncbi:hypothetical protein RIF29_29179 [Crotalaria pallida]|uniref:Uncharacterized protein n=1 Tax=Crotalaria pallida TaxID=3830 RepID=A0AAN9HX84_CROPI